MSSTHQNLVRCTHCQAFITFSHSNIIDYILGKEFICTLCNTHLDCWALAKQGIKENFMGYEALCYAGAQITSFLILLQPNEKTIFKFSDYGIPIDSRICYINYTPQGGTIFPTEMHGNVVPRRKINDQAVLYPAQISPLVPPEPTKVYVTVAWIHNKDANEAWHSLYDAFNAYASGDHSAVIIPANVSVEASLYALMERYLQPSVSKNYLNEFLDSHATYGQQLNVLLPIFTNLKNLPKLPKEIIGLLNRLRNCRNKLAHEGNSGITDDREISDLLSAALFGFNYIRHLYKAADLS